MSTQRSNSLNQELDVGGSFTHSQNMVHGDEPLQLGRIVNSGNGSGISAGATVTLTGLSGMSLQSIGNYIQISGFSNNNNNGVFLISEFINTNSVRIVNPSAVTESGVFSFNERKPYSLEDDVNYARTDRAAIKGTDYYDPVPTYTRCENQNLLIPANLSNIAGNTLDAKSLVVTRKFRSKSVNNGESYITITDVGNLKHADSVDVTGIPVYDGFEAGNEESTYVNLLDTNGLKVFVLSGQFAGQRIYGRTRVGTSISPNSVEIEFRSVQDGHELSTSQPYTWEENQTSLVDIYYAYRECMSNLDENALRTNEINGLVSNSGTGTGLPNANQVGQVLYSVDGINFKAETPITSANGWLVNDQGYLLVN